MNPRTNNVGTSGWHGFKPAAEKHITIPSLEGKVRYEVIGKDVIRNTFIYIFPHELKDKIKKYRGLKQRLIGPGVKVSDFTKKQDPEAEIVTGEIREQDIIPGRMSKLNKPIVCQSTGTYYPSVKMAAAETGLSGQLIGQAINHKITHAKGHIFRFATAAEIEQRRMIGEMAPMVQCRKPNRDRG